jgi:hypothetical protein
VYPLPKESLMRLAYSFEDSGRRGHIHRGLSDAPGQKQLHDVVRQWNNVWRSSRPVLQVCDEGTGVRFYDTRPCASQRSWFAEGLEADVYRLCDYAQTPTALKKQLANQRGTEISPAEIEKAINRLLESKVLLSMNEKLLALGVGPDLSRHGRTSL